MVYTIGEMAKMLGVPASTLRYYDKEGLLPFVARSSGGIRQFRESDIESLKLLDEAGFSRLSLAAEGIFVTSKKARHTAICRQKSAAFCEMTLEKAFFTRAVCGCISGVVVLDVR
jgi:hypothetical protein